MKYLLRFEVKFSSLDDASARSQVVPIVKGTFPTLLSEVDKSKIVVNSVDVRLQRLNDGAQPVKVALSIN